MSNLIAYTPTGATLPRVWTYGKASQVHAVRKQMAKNDLESLKRWDKMGIAFYVSDLHDPARLPTVRAMSEKEFTKIERDHYLSTPAKEITKEDYWYALEVLPPMHYQNGSFLMSEFMSGPYTEQYIEMCGRYFSKMVDAYDRSTWMDTNDISLLGSE